jgi:ubiquinone/menaquinone biosynthesis C-methylase UbiE
VYVGLEAQDHHVHRRFPERLAFTLNNRIRRLLEPPDRLILKLGLRASDVVVDFGCGPGFYTIPIAKVAARTIAVDVSSGMLERTASNAKKNNVAVDLLMTDGTAIKLGDESADLIFLNHVFHEIADRPKVIGEFLRIMKRSGRLAIVERTRGGIFAWMPGPPIIDQTEVTREFERAGFKLAQTISHGNDSIIVGKKS